MHGADLRSNTILMPLEYGIRTSNAKTQAKNRSFSLKPYALKRVNHLNVRDTTISPVKGTTVIRQASKWRKRFAKPKTQIATAALTQR